MPCTGGAKRRLVQGKPNYLINLMLNKNKYSIITSLIIFFLFFTVALTGCAAPRATKKILGSRKLAKKQYLPLATVCANYELSWDWDGFSKVINIKKHNLEIKLSLGSSLILYNNKVQDLGKPVRLYKGLIMVPTSFSRLFFKRRKPVLKPRKVKKRFTIKKIAIDAGHGGKDPGAVGKGGIKEKRIVLDIVKRLKKELAKKNITVILTRDRDVFLPLKKRSQIANYAEADFFISIHANAVRSASVRGFEAYYLSTDYDDFAKATQLRENAAVKFETDSDYEYSSNLNVTLWDMMLRENKIESYEMANSIARELRRNLNLKTRYIKGAMFYVLKGAKMPAVLLEVGYLTNRTEAARLNNPHYRQMLVEAIVAGIIRYKKRFEATNGFSM